MLIFSHIDDFKVINVTPKVWIKHIAATLYIKSHNLQDYYLGNKYIYHDGQDIWINGTKTYTKEAIA